MKKVLRVLLTMVLVLALCVPASMEVEAATKKSITVTTQAALKKALTSGKYTGITVAPKTAKTITVPKGKYSKVALTVKGAKATIKNYGVFKSVTIKDAKTFSEYASGNTVTTSDKKLSLKATKKATIKKLSVKSSSGKVTVTIDGQISSMTVSGKSEVELTQNGKMGKVTLYKPVSFTVDGAASSTLTIYSKAAAAGSDISAYVPVKVAVYSDVSISLFEGAEGSTVSLKNTPGEEFVLENNTLKTVKLTNERGEVEEISSMDTKIFEDTEDTGSKEGDDTKTDDSSEDDDSVYVEETTDPMYHYRLVKTYCDGVLHREQLYYEDGVTVWLDRTYYDLGGGRTALRDHYSYEDDGSLVGEFHYSEEGPIISGWYYDDDFQGNVTIQSEMAGRYVIKETWLKPWGDILYEYEYYHFGSKRSSKEYVEDKANILECEQTFEENGTVASKMIYNCDSGLPESGFYLDENGRKIEIWFNYQDDVLISRSEIAVDGETISEKKYNYPSGTLKYEFYKDGEKSIATDYDEEGNPTVQEVTKAGILLERREYENEKLVNELIYDETTQKLKRRNYLSVIGEWLSEIYSYLDDGSMTIGLYNEKEKMVNEKVYYASGVMHFYREYDRSGNIAVLRTYNSKEICIEYRYVCPDGTLCVETYDETTGNIELRTIYDTDHETILSQETFGGYTSRVAGR